MSSGNDQKKVLNSWKEIAHYLGKGVRTAQRWENSGLPVRRIGNGPHAAVIAVREEIDRWVGSAKSGGVAATQQSPPLDLVSVRKTIALARYLRQRQRFLRQAHRSALESVASRLDALHSRIFQMSARRGFPYPEESVRYDDRFGGKPRNLIVTHAAQLGASMYASGMLILNASPSPEVIEMFVLQDSEPGKYLCAICKEPVELERSKTDGDGHAVHEECYAELLKQASREGLGEAA